MKQKIYNQEWYLLNDTIDLPSSPALYLSGLGLSCCTLVQAIDHILITKRSRLVLRSWRLLVLLNNKKLYNP